MILVIFLFKNVLFLYLKINFPLKLVAVNFAINSSIKCNHSAQSLCEGRKTLKVRFRKNFVTPACTDKKEAQYQNNTVETGD